MALDPASLPDDVDALKRLIVGLAREAVHASTLIEKLRGELARMKRARFGTSSEKLGTRLEQLELAIEALEVDEAERLAGTPAVAEARRPLGSSPPGGTCRRTCRARAWSTPVPAPARLRGSLRRIART